MQESKKEYYGEINLTVINNSHTQEFLFLETHCRQHSIVSPRILEIGCASGYFSSLLQSKGMYVFGVEPFTTQAHDKHVVDDFFFGSVEKFLECDNSYLYKTFDAIILGDVIEHLVFPDKVISILGKYLNNNGVFIISVPNINHIGISNMLKNGEWIYQKYGILDSTHLHFFNHISLRNMFIKLGYGIEKTYNVTLPLVYVYPDSLSDNSVLKKIINVFFYKNCFNKIKKKLKIIINFIIKSKFKESDKSTCFQIVAMASKKAFRKSAFVDDYPKNILVLTTAPNSSLAELRLKNPLTAYCSNVDGELLISSPDRISDKNLIWADVLIVHRECSSAILDYIRKARRLGLSIIYDTDDLLINLPQSSMATIDEYSKQLMKYIISTADRVTCTTKLLKNELIKISDNVSIIDNIIDYKIIKNKNFQNSDKCTLIIASSDNIYVDFLLDDIVKIHKEFQQIDIVVIGNICKYFRRIKSRIRFYDLLPPCEFNNLLLNINNGIGMIPLEDTIFNRCKSAIKYYHYTICGIVTIASDIEPYISVIRHKENGILTKNTKNSWYSAVSNLINNLSLRQLMLKNAYLTLHKNASKDKAISNWKKVFSGIPKPNKYSCL